MASIVGVITARGGSKGIPGKNVRALAGKPMIAWTIEAALDSRMLTRLLVSTDCPQIADVARRHGAEVPFLRPAEIARDETPHIDVLLHALRWMECVDGCLPEYLVTLQPTSPLRTPADIDGACELAITSGAQAVISVCDSEVHPFLARRMDERGILKPFLELGGRSLRRQDLPPAYRINGAVYVNRSESIRSAKTMLPEGTCGYVMPVERSLDIDTPWEFELVDLILRNTHVRKAA